MMRTAGWGADDYKSTDRLPLEALSKGMTAQPRKATQALSKLQMDAAKSCTDYFLTQIFLLRDIKLEPRGSSLFKHWLN
jgi:hypothetical protein